MQFVLKLPEKRVDRATRETCCSLDSIGRNSPAESFSARSDESALRGLMHAWAKADMSVGKVCTQFFLKKSLVRRRVTYEKRAGAIKIQT